MIKEFIPYEEALALKELGFDESCFGYYNVTGEISTEEILFQGEVVSIKAPLYQQAFRWFREKHDLHGLVSGFGDGKYECSVWKKLNILNSKSYCKSYEQAEFSCLKKLIEICTNK